MFAFRTKQEKSILAGRFFFHQREMTRRTIGCAGFIPEGKAAFRIITAAIKNFALPGLFLNDATVASFFRTGHAGTNRLGRLTFRIA